MKTVFIHDGVVIGMAQISNSAAVAVAPHADAATWQVTDDSPVDVGWIATQGEGGAYTFEVPEQTLPLLTPMTLYMAFKPAERIVIKASIDPMVKEFWDMYELSVQLDKPTDPNLISVREALEYLAAPVSPGPGAGILSSPDRVEQIRQGIPQ